MTRPDAPLQRNPQPINDHWTVLPSWLPVPGMGVLSVNSFVIEGPEPVLVDTGLSALSEEALDALGTCTDPVDLRWIWLSHTDADHIGNLKRVLGAAPNATVVANFLGAGKMGMMEGYDLGRVRLLEPGEVFEVPGRRFHQIRPAYYDAPETMGFSKKPTGSCSQRMPSGRFCPNRSRRSMRLERLIWTPDSSGGLW